MERAVLHVDLDQFIVAVELLRRPELRGLPVLVGGTGDPTRRGVVAGASYEARERGVRSGTPLRTAAKRCPEAVFLPVDQDAYLAVSARFYAALREFDGVVEEFGWDEAFLQLDTADAERSAAEVRAAVAARTELSCSIGIGDNKLRAKLASAFAKPSSPLRSPRGTFRLDRDNWEQVMHERPTDALWGIGGKTAARLAEHGITTVGALARADRDALASIFGPRNGPWLVALARGIDPTPVSAEPYRPRSYGHEVTFQQDVSDPEVLRAELARLCDLIATDLHAAGTRSARVVVKLRDSRFQTATHGVPVDPPTADADALTTAAHHALDRFTRTRPTRLIGARAESLTSENP